MISRLVYPLGFLFLSVMILSGHVKGANDFTACGFPAIYNFGDSNSDTGGKSAAFTEVTPPNGETFFGKDGGRYCDGRLIIDFITEELKMPYLSAYLNSVGTNFRHGANFATGGSSILPGGYSPFYLGVQISQFVQFKSRTSDLYNQLSSNRHVAHFRSSLPRPEDFSKALYTFDIGQNDLSYGFQHMSEEQVRASIPDTLTQFSQAVHKLYKEGAQVFWVHNTGPIGCLPHDAIYYKLNSSALDKYGCVAYQNEIAQDFNRQLKDKVSQLRKQLPSASFTYVDVYSAKYKLISNAKNLGFVDPNEFCCASCIGRHRINCEQKAVINGTVCGSACKNPSNHVSWDGVHYSQAANLWLSKQIINGSFSDPPLPITKACQSIHSS